VGWRDGREEHVLRRVRDYENFEVWSREGRELGRVEDFYFDEDKWTVRYIVVTTGTWLTGRSVLVSPLSVDRLRWNDGRVDVRLTEAQIKAAPSADLAQPISQQWEAEYSMYYGIPNYWAGPGIWGIGMTPSEALSAVEVTPPSTPVPRDTRHLRAVKEVAGYHIHARDGEIGHVDDFLTDDRSWTIRYLMIDTSNWIGGRTVLIPPEWAHRIDWADKQVYVDVTREAVKESPEYDPAADIDGKYEQRLADAYRRPVKPL